MRHDAWQQGHWRPTATSCRPDLLVVLSPLGRVPSHTRHVVLHAEDYAGLVGVRLHRQDDPLVVLLAQPASLEQGNVARQFLHVTVRAQR